MLLLALSTAHKLGLGLTAAVFAGFALVSSILVPRWRPQFPGRWLPIFLVVSVLLFLGMLTAVATFGKEEPEAEAAGHEATGQATTAEGTTTGQTTTGQAPAAKTVQVSEVDFKIRLPETHLAPGSYTFEVRNDGKVPHDLTIKGAGVSAATPDFGPGQTSSVKVDLKPGSYDFYCAVPGHRQLGMEQKVTVS